MNEVCKTLGLTKAEWEVLEHRLAESSALADVMEDMGYAREDAEYVAEELWAGRLQTALKHSELLTRDVLIDAVEGSTWAACMQSGYQGGEVTIQAVNACARVIEVLARKVEAYARGIGEPRLVPDWRINLSCALPS